jgi:hypothetical protein
MYNVKVLILVYNASFSLSGGFEYLSEFIKTGKEPCALCAITHNSLTEKKEWKDCKANLGIPVKVLYLNQLDENLKNIVDGDAPCILAESDGRIIKLLGRKELERCNGDVKLLNEKIRSKLNSVILKVT